MVNLEDKFTYSDTTGTWNDDIAVTYTLNGNSAFWVQETLAPWKEHRFHVWEAKPPIERFPGNDHERFVHHAQYYERDRALLHCVELASNPALDAQPEEDDHNGT